MHLNLSARICCIVSALCFSLPAIIFSQTHASDIKSGTASISGRITIGGQPAAGKKVLIADLNTGWGSPSIGSGGGGTQGRTYFSTVTDADGKYRVIGLPAGKYEVNVKLLEVYVPADPAGRRSRSITLDEGEEAKGIDFALVRGGVITGRLLDAGGNSIAGALVVANTTDQAGVRGLEWGLLHNRDTLTDDRGVYRIYGLPAGRYRVSADGSRIGPNGDTVSDRSKRYPRIYHPNVTDEKQAAIVKVKEGAEASGIDINLGKKMAIYEVTGRVIDPETGLPLSQRREMVSCHRVNSEGIHTESFSIYATVDSQGNFRFAGLTPGRYGLEFSLRSSKEEPYTGHTIFEVKNENVSGLEIRTTRQIVIKGVAVFDNHSNPELIDWVPYATISASIIPTDDPSTTSHMGSSYIDTDGSFSLLGLKPGIVRLLASSINLKPLPHILRVEKDGVELKNGIEVKPGDQVTGIRLIMTYGTGAIRGQIKVGGGTLPENTEFLVIAKHKDVINYYGHAKTDSKGRFVIEGLIAGEYEVQASAEQPNGAGSSLYTSLRVRVTGGAETLITPTFDLGPKKKENVR
jgi:carboxypeptidase family protein